jgi:hypothetical protein
MLSRRYQPRPPVRCLVFLAFFPYSFLLFLFLSPLSLFFLPLPLPPALPSSSFHREAAPFLLPSPFLSASSPLLVSLFHFTRDAYGAEEPKREGTVTGSRKKGLLALIGLKKKVETTRVRYTVSATVRLTRPITITPFHLWMCLCVVGGERG